MGDAVAQALLPVLVFAAVFAVIEDRTAKSGYATTHLAQLQRTA